MLDPISGGAIGIAFALDRREAKGAFNGLSLFTSIPWWKLIDLICRFGGAAVAWESRLKTSRD